MSNNRGQAIALEYVLGLSIAFVLITGLLTASVGFVDDQRTQVTRAELEVIGQQVAADIEAIDRLVVHSESSPTVRMSRDLPEVATGTPYTLEVVSGADPYLVISSNQPAVRVEIEFSNTTAIAGTTVSGGPIELNLTDGGYLRLEGGSN